jgi:hypothetical protein
MKNLMGPVALAAVLALGGCGSDAQASDPGKVSDQDVETAVRAARQRVGGSEARLTSASVAVASNEVESSNTGSDCTSDQTLAVRLLGTFPDVAIGGTPGVTDTEVTVMDLVVDRETGDTCLVSVNTGDARLSDGATPLLVEDITG